MLQYFGTSGGVLMSTSTFLVLVFLSIVSTSSYWIQEVASLSVLIAEPHIDLITWNVTAKQYLNASNFYLVMEPDCHLVTYNGFTPYLTTNWSRTPVGPSDSRICYALMQADGHFVVYQHPNATYRLPLWNSNTWSVAFTNSTYRYLILGRDGRLRAYEPNGVEITVLRPFVPVNRDIAPSLAPDTSSQSGSVSNNLSSILSRFPPELEWKPRVSISDYPFMPAEYFLSPGCKLRTLNGRFVLVLGQDCKLQSQELWEENSTVKSVIWDPQVESTSSLLSGPNCTLRLEQDGLLEVRDNVSGVVYWSSGVSGDVNDTVNWVLDLNADDGHVSVSDILDPTNVLWTGFGAESRSVVRVWPVAIGIVGGILAMTIAGFALLRFYIYPRFLYPVDWAFQLKLQSAGGNVRVLSPAEIKKATKNFGSRIGHGGFGDVFHGRLGCGQEIAAKVLTAGSHQSKAEFYNEIELLSVVHHKYLVSLLGYSSTRKHQVLIYEYMGGGDLRHRLQGAGAASSPLSWRQRTSITLQVAEGIEYLHDMCTPAIIHRDIKSNNILLTTSLLVAKVADFGLSKLRRKDQVDATHVTTVVKGTPGYLDPEYHETGMLTDRSDVYAFGIVLMEILTGQNQINISQKVSEARRLEQYEELADPNLGGRFDRNEFVSLVELSLWCARKSNSSRPYMREVVEKLREIGMISLVAVPLEPVMSFGEHFQHSEAEDFSANASFDGFPSTTSLVSDDMPSS